MPSRKRKSRQKRSVRSNPASILKQLLPPPAEILGLSDFLRRYAPLLETRQDLSSDSCEYKHFFISPLDTIKPALHIKAAECREPLPSIVEDVIWSLVQRRTCNKRIGKECRNVLAQGFSCVPPDEYPSSGKFMIFPTMRQGLTQLQANENVTFCKNSLTFLDLHSDVGDEVIRMILLHTRLFVPCSMESGGQEAMARGNLRLLCGPPLPMAPRSYNQIADRQLASMNDRRDVETCSRPKKKRQRQQPPQDPSLLGNKTISRFNLYYADFFAPNVGLPHKHPLKNHHMNPEKLLDLMTGISSPGGTRNRRRWRRLRSSGTAISRHILRSEKVCDFHRLLDHYCPIQNLDDLENLRDTDALKRVVQYHCQAAKVISFVNSVMSHVFPFEFWGSAHNFDCFLGAVDSFVMLRRKERLSNKRLMQGIRITQMTWLHGEKRKNVKLSRTDHTATSRLALHVFRWVFRGFLIPLLRSCFYVTEAEFSAKRILYYRKPIWAIFRTLSMRKLLKAQYRQLNKREARECLFSCKMGFSQLRLLPKTTGVRPIAQLSRPANVLLEDLLSPCKRRRVDFIDSSADGKHVEATNFIRPSHESTNSILSNVFDALTYECGRHEESFGSGLQGLHEFYPRYQQYIQRLRCDAQQTTTLNLFFASLDIEKCYDNIDQGCMLEIATRHLCHEDYAIKKIALFRQDQVRGSIRRRDKRVVGPPWHHSLIRLDHTTSDQLSRNAVHVVNSYQVVNRKKICELLQEHLENHLLVAPGRHEPRYLHQSCGIAQGSILSMLLCNLYYGNVENLLLNDDNPQSPRLIGDWSSKISCKEFLARQVDDFLFISTSSSDVSKFLQRMWLGRPEIGVKINHDKSLLSEPISFSVEGGDKNSSVSDQMPVAPSRSNDQWKLFPWCGMLFNAMSGEVYVDYERFHNNLAIDSLTVDSCGREGQNLVHQMQNYVRPRCLPILYDGTINSHSTIILNFFQMMLYAAVKSAQHIRSMKINAASSSNDSFVLSCIQSMAAFAGRRIRSNIHNQSRGQRSFIIDDKLLAWLTWRAFNAVFRRCCDLDALRRCIRIRSQENAFSTPDLEATLALAYRRFCLEKIMQF